MRGLYTGSTSAIMANVAENSVLFGARSFTIGWTATYFKTHELNDFQMALAGSGAAFFSSIVVCPTELVKTRMQAATELSKSGTFAGSNTTVRSTVTQILSEGPTAPFRGLVGTWGRECPGYLILFYAYQKCYNFIRRHELLSNNFNAALSGGVAGGCYWTAMLPIDAVKSRQQVLSIGSTQSIPFRQCAEGLYQTAGVRGFYAGLCKCEDRFLRNICYCLVTSNFCLNIPFEFSIF